MSKNMSIDKEKKSNASRMLTNSQLSLFCEELSLIVKAGITVSEGLYIMREETEDKSDKEMLSNMIDSVESGSPLSEAMVKTKIFPTYTIDMIKIGELSGKLEEVVGSLARYYKRETELMHTIKQAVFYPVIMLIMMLAVIGVLVMQVMPVFNQVFMQLGSELTGVAATVLNAAEFARNNGIFFIVLLVLIVLLIAYLGVTSNGKVQFKKFKERSFITKKIVEKIAVSRFSNGMSLMISSGLDTDQSLEMAQKLVEHENLSERITTCRDSINEGEGFAVAIAKSKIFAGMYARMLSIGVKTGSIDSVMEKISDEYDKEVQSRISSIIAVIEPALVAVLSVVVGIILLSIMLPLMSIMSAMG